MKIKDLLTLQAVANSGLRNQYINILYYYTYKNNYKIDNMCFVLLKLFQFSFSLSKKLFVFVR